MKNDGHMLDDLVQELLSYQGRCWRATNDKRWSTLSNHLGQYQPPPHAFVLERERKWELVSALQKTVRRADKRNALRLISAMDAVPEEYAYFWRRMCVIACEDIGPADDVLATFVVACATLAARKSCRCLNHKLWCFLASQMCDLTCRSRVYCSYGILDAAITLSQLPELIPADREIVATILQQRGKVIAAADQWTAWQKKNDWRAEGLLRFVGTGSTTQLTTHGNPLPRFKMLYGLPSYSYDMHTRTGLEMLQRLVRGIPEAEELRRFFALHKVNSPHRVLGEALFFVEGGRIQNELICEPLSQLEQRFFAHKHGLLLRDWWTLRGLAQQALEQGIIDRVRQEVLSRHYGQATLQLIAKHGRAE